MEKIWILADERGGRPLPIATELAAAARRFAPTVEAFIWGDSGASVAEGLGLHGVRTAFDVGDLAGALPGPAVSAAIASQLQATTPPDAIFIGATYDGRDVAARLSARLDLPVITNAVGIEEVDGKLVSSHAVFGGAEVVKAKFTAQGPNIFVIRSKSFAAEETGGQPAEIVAVSVPDLGATNAAKIVEHHVEERAGLSLDEASIVVSGGRGLGAPEKYALIEELAKLLNGAAGASRAIVDAGWVPYSHQVGQTGKTVKPDVYLAFGISGATQHLVGMKGAKHIIAVNKDASAPIFEIADLGVVGDLQDVLPKLIDAIRSRP
ncbi:MAG TPA: electron transfer flavoprotein subunit alpha/FixB family protein [Acidimicrobiales bacterium]|nr:electron transfer flavoprotein subunit alpha/FixB family protein [Acidimicrobiales bacterium]